METEAVSETVSTWWISSAGAAGCRTARVRAFGAWRPGDRRGRDHVHRRGGGKRFLPAGRDKRRPVPTPGDRARVWLRPPGRRGRRDTAIHPGAIQRVLRDAAAHAAVRVRRAHSSGSQPSLASSFANAGRNASTRSSADVITSAMRATSSISARISGASTRNPNPGCPWS